LVIPYGYRAQDFEPYQWAPTSYPIRLAYIGAASRRARNLNPLITSLAKSNSKLPFQLQIVGDVSMHFRITAQQLGLSNIEFTGRVSYTESIRLICKAGILILIGNKSPYQVPGKTFLYLASGRPLLYIHQMSPASDPTWELLRSFPGVRSVPNEANALTMFFNQLSETDFRQWEQQASNHPNMPELTRFEQSILVQPLAKALGKLVHSEQCYS
jgi:hypothetical protein